jgi:WXXGXW repeat (2 copies)
MIKKIFLSAILGVLGLAIARVSATAGYVYVQVGPPAAVVERVPARPGAGYVWVGGYWHWNGGKYVWAPGYWARHAGAWCPGHWRHVAAHGWYWVPGHWC